MTKPKLHLKGALHLVSRNYGDLNFD